MDGVWSFRTILKKAMAGVEGVEGVGTWSVMSVVNQVILHENAVRALVHGVWGVDVIVAPVLDAAVVQFMGEGVFHVCRVLFGRRPIIPLFIRILQTILPFLIGRNCMDSFFILYCEFPLVAGVIAQWGEGPHADLATAGHLLIAALTVINFHFWVSYFLICSVYSVAYSGHHSCITWTLGPILNGGCHGDWYILPILRQPPTAKC